MSGTLLVTGAGGFLAGYTARAFADAGWTCIGVGRSDPNRQASLYRAFHLHDLSSADRVATLVERYRPSAIVHFAAPSSVPASVARPLGDLQEHITPTGNLLEGARLTGAKPRFLLLSSAAVYGNPAALPVSEDAPLAPVSPYGFHKVMQETLADEYHQVFGIPVAKARVFSTFGEGLRKLAVWEIARRALGGDVAVHGTGDEVRDYLYAGDVARALLAIITGGAFAGEAVNVASGRGTSVRELAQTIFDELGIAGPPQFDGLAPRGNPTAWIANVDRLAALGFAPTERLDAALRRTVRWIQTS